MKREWILVLAALILAASAGAAWWSHRHLADLDSQRSHLDGEMKEKQTRESLAAAERAEYERLGALADQIARKVRWEKDSTYLLRWFADTAAEEGVQLLGSQVAPLRPGMDATPDHLLQRSQFNVRLEGTYAQLVKYIDRVERSPHMMVVEKLTLSARRNAGDNGEARLTVSTLYPVSARERAAAMRTGGTP